MNSFDRKLSRETKAYMKIMGWDMKKFRKNRKEIRFIAGLQRETPCENCDNCHCAIPYKTYICASQR